ncbi:MAG TPA: pyruvate formate lyase family protein [Symbiobacteriaceae bacterium]|nr:pyruvate formate lyase family protein [Symbiobacteriaceae bacterium]
MNRFAVEANFTATYRRHRDAHPAIREAICLRAQFPDILRPIQDGDLFAGRIAYAHVGFSPQEGPAGMGYYCKTYPLRKALEGSDLSPAERATAEDLLAFWETEQTAYKVREAYPPDMAHALPSDNWTGEPGIAFPLYRLAGGCLNFDKLVRLGLPGLRAEVAASGRSPLADAMLMTLDLFREICLFYADRAVPDLAAVLRKIADAAPSTFREAAQLAWLYALVSGVRNYGRLDEYLGDFCVRDLEAGILTEAEALAQLQSLWRLMAARRFVFDGRVIIGGMGRRNPGHADRLALLCMEATRTVHEVEPQLSLRCYTGMNPALLEKALTVIGEGRTFPMLYNDDVNVDAVAHAFDVPREEAVHYIPYGCGEYVLNHRSYGTPSGVINLAYALEATLHSGQAFPTFEDLWNEYRRSVESYAAVMADQEALEYRVAGETAPFLFLSMLYDDCIARGKGIFAGGIRYLGGTLETYGNINTADSLTAIKMLVYDQQVLTLDEVRKALAADFAGHEQIQRLLKNAPKFGNDDPVADAMAARVHEHVCNAVRSQGERAGLHSYLVVVINNSGNTTLGHLTGASADGRKAGTPLTNGNTPSGGSDRNGVTALLNSIVRLDPAIHAGAVHNLKFGRELFESGRPQLEALLAAYFESGGTQAMITVVSRAELERAMAEPQHYGHLFVRVGGFSARFVELPRDVQLDIVSRTLY